MKTCHSPDEDNIICDDSLPQADQPVGSRTHLDTAYIPALGKHIRTLRHPLGRQRPYCCVAQIMTQENWTKFHLKTKQTTEKKIFK